MVAVALCSLASAQTAVELKQQSLGKWRIGAAQYSGITALGGNRYAMVSDKEPTDGFFLFRIDQSALTGDVTNVYLEGFKGNRSPKVDAQGISIRDCEGVAYFPQRNTLFISGEGDQRILEYDMEVPASLKGSEPYAMARVVNVPRFLSAIATPNPGFQLHIGVDGDLDIPENNGWYIVENGRVRLTDIKPDSIVTPGGLAAMFMAAQPMVMDMMLDE